MPNFNSIGLLVSETQVAENRYLPLTGGIALTTVYALSCYTVIHHGWVGSLSLYTPSNTASIIPVGVIIDHVNVSLLVTETVC